MKNKCTCDGIHPHCENCLDLIKEWQALHIEEQMLCTIAGDNEAIKKYKA